MKKIKILFTCTLVCILIFSCTINTFAINAEHNKTEECIVELKMQNIQEVQTFSGYEITCDLVQEIENPSESESTYAIGWIVVGQAKFKLTLMPDNGFGSIGWSFTLANGALITNVRATFVVEKNTLLFDPNIAKVVVNKPVSMMVTASGSEGFGVKESLTSSQKIRFKWSGVTIQSTQGGYSVPSDNRTGTVADFL